MADTENQNKDEKEINRRRRSSFFQRRLSVDPSELDDSKTSSPRTFISSSNQNEDTRQDEERNQYFALLKKEKEDWKESLEKLKKENKKLEGASHPLVNRSEVLDLLTDEDKKFLEDRPDYLGLARLLDSVAETVALKHTLVTNAINNVHRLMQDTQASTTRLTEQVIHQNTHELREFDLLFENDQEKAS